MTNTKGVGAQKTGDSMITSQLVVKKSNLRVIKKHHRDLTKLRNKPGFRVDNEYQSKEATNCKGEHHNSSSLVIQTTVREHDSELGLMKSLAKVRYHQPLQVDISSTIQEPPATGKVTRISRFST